MDAADSAENGELPAGSEVVNFPDFVRVLAHFKPLKKNAEKNKLNSREEKLRCEYIRRDSRRIKFECFLNRRNMIRASSSRHRVLFSRELSALIVAAL